MIIGYVGTPGSGKTYDAVRKILDNLKLGKKVYTNIDGLQNDICNEYIKAYTGLDDYQLNSQLIHLPDDRMKHIGQIADDLSLVVIDEVHRLFSNRDWNTSENQAFCNWASVHRHQKINIVLITQDLEKIDKHVRSLIEWCFFYRKINFLGSLVNNRYLRYTYSGSDHNGQPVSKNQLSYDHKIFRCYKSYSTDEGQEITIDKPVNILRHPIFYAIPVALAAFLYFGNKSSIRTGDPFGTKKALASAQSFQHKQPSSDNKAANPAPTTNPEAQQCTSYKAQLPDGTMALVSDLPDGARVLKCYQDKTNVNPRPRGVTVPPSPF